MRRMISVGLALIASVGLAGCRGSRFAARPSYPAAEPPLIVSGGDVIPQSSGPTTIADSGSPILSSNQTTVVDRNPMLSRPRDYYDNTGGSKVRKTLAAGFIGVPSGIGAQMRQLVTGEPAPPIAGASTPFVSTPPATVTSPTR